MGLLVVGCPGPILEQWCAVLTQGHFLNGTAGGVLSRANTGAVVRRSLIRTFSNMGLMVVCSSKANTGVVVYVLYSLSYFFICRMGRAQFC